MPQHTFKFTPNDTGAPTGKLADLEIQFTSGLLTGLKLIGFAVWQRKGGTRIVTFPARQYSVAGERHTFSLLRPTLSRTAHENLTIAILSAYEDFTNYLAAAGDALATNSRPCTACGGNHHLGHDCPDYDHAGPRTGR